MGRKTQGQTKQLLFLPVLLWFTGEQERTRGLANSSDFMGLVVYIFLIACLLRLWDCEDFKFNLKERLACSRCGFKEMLEVKSLTSKTRGKYKDKTNQESRGFGGPGPPLQTPEGWQHWRYFPKRGVWPRPRENLMGSHPCLRPPSQHPPNSPPVGTQRNHRPPNSL